MNKNLTIRILLLIVISIFLYSCMHDEISSISDSTNSISKEYTNKSLWKEDEKYIENVKKVFDQYADKDYFYGKYGNVLWNYALTMGTFDENFLEAPIVKNGKVIFVITAERREDRVFFKIKNEKESNDFFDILVFKDRKYVKGNAINGNDGTSKSNCYTVTVTWTWTDETTGEVLRVDTFTKTKCTASGPILTDPTPASDCVEQDCTGGGTGGGGYPYPETTPDLCDKTKLNLQNQKAKENINKLIEASKTSDEKAFLYKKDGTALDIVQGNEHSAEVKNATDYKGIYHNHTPTGIKMFSVRDIILLHQIVASQLNSQNSHEAFVGMVATEPCNCPPENVRYINYIINFNGDMQNAGNVASFNTEKIKEFMDYYEVREMELKNIPEFRNGTGFTADLNTTALEKLFFDTLKKMNINPDTVVLQKIEKDGTVNNVVTSPNGTLSHTPCP